MGIPEIRVMDGTTVIRTGSRPRTHVLAGLFIVLALGVGGATPVYGEDGSVKEGARSAGRAVGGAVREIGQGAKKVGKTVGEAAKEGGREFKKAVKGEN